MGMKTKLLAFPRTCSVRAELFWATRNHVPVLWRVCHPTAQVLDCKCSLHLRWGVGGEQEGNQRLLCPTQINTRCMTRPLCRKSRVHMSQVAAAVGQDWQGGSRQDFRRQSRGREQEEQDLTDCHRCFFSLENTDVHQVILQTFLHWSGVAPWLDPVVIQYCFCAFSQLFSRAVPSSNCGCVFFVRRMHSWCCWVLCSPIRVGNQWLGTLSAIEIPATTRKVAQVLLSEFCFSLILSQKQLQRRFNPRAYGKKKLGDPQCTKRTSADFSEIQNRFCSGRCRSCCRHCNQQFTLNLVLCLSTSKSERVFVFLV